MGPSLDRWPTNLATVPAASTRAQRGMQRECSDRRTPDEAPGGLHALDCLALNDDSAARELLPR